MTVMHQGVGRVDNDVARGQDAREHVQVLAATRGRACAQGRIKRSNLHEDVTAHRHAYAGAHARGRDGEQGPAVTLFTQGIKALRDVTRTPDARRHVLGESASRLEPPLGRVSLLKGQHDASRRRYVRGRGEGVDHGRQPVRVDDRVVVRKDDDLATSRQNAAVTGPGQAGTRRGDDTQPRVVDPRKLLTGKARVRRVVDDDERETLMVLIQDGAHSFLKHVGGTDRAHDDGRVNVSASPLFPASR